MKHDAARVATRLYLSGAHSGSLAAASGVRLFSCACLSARTEEKRPKKSPFAMHMRRVDVAVTTVVWEVEGEAASASEASSVPPPSSATLKDFEERADSLPEMIYTTSPCATCSVKRVQPAGTVRSAAIDRSSDIAE